MINDYLVRWSTANHDNLAKQLMCYKANSFTIQNQAGHLTLNQVKGERDLGGGKTSPDYSV
jgi:hypothetical protein